ncbi:MAG TPA: gamma-glutamyl-gamma-aminobutyrate hydrolase family protein [Actinomycetota bacterium]|nr:gamma-glutamyl-gamma-aminobutyrate hydrolase family protein [Actinomycetota bacterium]
MSRPLIGVIAYGLARGRVDEWSTGAAAVPSPYLEAIRRAGGHPVAISAPEPGSPSEILEPFDGLMLIGGGDVNPARFGQRRHPEVYGIEEEREALEIDLLLEADRAGVPVFGICRGLQVVNVAFGGTLHQHLPDLAGVDQHSVPGGHRRCMHDVKVAESSRLHEACGQATIDAASSHHQGIDALAEALIPVAWTGDGLIEAIERPEGWVVAVQWHPEETEAADPAQQALFDAFAEQARRRSGG